MLESRARLPFVFRPGVSIIHKLVANWLLTDPNYVIDSDPSKLKNYQVQKHQDMGAWYLCGGRLRTGKKLPLNVIVALVMITCAVLFFIYEAPWTWSHLSPAVPVMFAYLWFLTAMFFVKAATLDPGIQPRNLHVPFDASLLERQNGPDEYFNTVSLPYFSDRVNGVTVKYCATCHIWRAPRMSHCAVCNSCVLVHDHHCVFLNNCVGYRNYRYFLWFLLTCVITSVYLATFTFLHCFWYRYSHVVEDGVLVNSFKASISQSPATFFLALAGCLASVYPLMLLGFHIFLTANNLTTREYLNYVRPLADTDDTYVNVYDRKSMMRNMWLTWVATPQCLSLLRPTEQYLDGDFTKERVPVLSA
ncbi:Palmitoyltransferase ERF2 [Metschnikowia bicuspidata var. bicuspidata NRRL YB-4993]|uniref:Palmitoyltransferase n=1 Tax=Metschnikowia bicuspidata var. bicuspidata NRRL YB-4993 TaxID=869754 RepID=A0A1A0HCI7_9ASCO|nr:Palmitoyltransferase ERF2 [Metschnikowia bicuspidata var. bicuspidata NRRL YB-4993]OBA21633.1 Palmitoyltransferase ERF2 [Metschnikowia bicuspidata var. bicuspidata NRRL YB-4993]